MSKIISDDDYKLMVKNNNPHVEVLGTYSGMKNKIQCRCLLCGDLYFPNAQDVKNGKKHRKCALKIVAKGTVKTNEKFLEELKNILPEVKPLEMYQNSKTKILCRCLVHNNEFYSTPDHLLKGKVGCDECKSDKIKKALTKSHDDYVHDLLLVNDNIEILGEYKTSKDPINVRCTKCGFVWDPEAGSLLQGNGCPHCVGRFKTTEEFILEIQKYNEDVEIIGEYVDSHTKIKYRCKECTHEWFAIPGNLRYSGCPECNMSRGEKMIKRFFQEHGINYIRNKMFPNLIGVGCGNLSYDFYLPDYNILLEYQGEFHDGTAYQQTEDDYEKQKEHDNRKRQYANDNNYELVEIWYYDYNDIENILKNKLMLNK